MSIDSRKIEIKFSYKIEKGDNQVNVYKENPKNNSEQIATEKPKMEIVTKIAIKKQQEVIEHLKLNSPKIWLYDNFLEKIPNSVIFYEEGKMSNGMTDTSYTNEINQKWIKLLDDVGRNSVEGFTTFQEQIIDWKIDCPNNNNDEVVLSSINKKINNEITNSLNKLYVKEVVKKIELKFPLLMERLANIV